MVVTHRGEQAGPYHPQQKPREQQPEDDPGKVGEVETGHIGPRLGTPCALQQHLTVQEEHRELDKEEVGDDKGPGAALGVEDVDTERDEGQDVVNDKHKPHRDTVKDDDREVEEEIGRGERDQGVQGNEVGRAEGLIVGFPLDRGCGCDESRYNDEGVQGAVDAATPIRFVAQSEF